MEKEDKEFILSCYWQAVRAARSEINTEKERELALSILKPFEIMMFSHYKWTVEEVKNFENMYWNPYFGKFERGEL